MNKKLLILSLLIVFSFIFSGCALTSEKKIEIFNQTEEKIKQESSAQNNTTDEELKKEIEKDADFSLDQNFSEMESVLK